MAPTRDFSKSVKAVPLATSPSNISVTSSGVSKAGRRKNQWTAERRRKAIRLYFFTTLSQVEIGQVLGNGYCKSDNERRIRELFLEDEVSSRSRWCKHTTAGHQESIVQWETFKQYKVLPWKKSRNLTRSTEGTTSGTTEVRENDDLGTSKRTQADLVLRTRPEASAINRINQLGSKYLPGHLSSVTSVYCHSLTSTIRSSWTSITSTFRSSKTSSIYRRSVLHEGQGTSTGVKSRDPPPKRLAAKIPSQLTKEEQWAWNILIDEEKFEVDNDAPEDSDDERDLLQAGAEIKNVKPPTTLSHFFLGVEQRPCGVEHLCIAVVRNPNTGREATCTTCGCSTVQSTALHVGNAGLEYCALDLCHKDFYDNTLLFYLVASESSTIEDFKSLISNGADFMVQNSSGESFMHFFIWDWCQRKTPELEFVYSHTFYSELIAFLEFLAAKEFPFSHRNEHGQSVAHLLFEHMHQNPIMTPSIQQIDRILNAVNTDIDAIDNQGYSVRQYLNHKYLTFWNDVSRDYHKTLITKMSQTSSLKSGDVALEFQKLYSVAQRTGQLWPDVVQGLGYSNLIDSKGDSPLIAKLKVWDESRPVNERNKCIEMLLELGVGINLKDRRGNTALVIAARRGFRSTVEQLLKSGANIYTVNYSNRSILFMTKGWLKIAKRTDDDQLYARIASCVSVLLHWQAVFEPPVHQQRLSAKTRAELAANSL